jgi:HSP90 family molecular chaperone
VVSSSPQDQRKKILELNEKNQLLSKLLEEFSDKTEKMVSSLVEGERSKACN